MWYIPGHRVYHQSKAGKICVVLDCIADFQEKSINKKLLSSPDLTNVIICVLTRFCEGKTQIQDPEDQQSFLKFLWWEKHDMEKESPNYVIHDYMFGVALSAICSNYILHMTDLENEAVFGKVQQVLFITIFM